MIISVIQWVFMTIFNTFQVTKKKIIIFSFYYCSFDLFDRYVCYRKKIIINIELSKMIIVLSLLFCY